jgi:hypothetical protein
VNIAQSKQHRPVHLSRSDRRLLLTSTLCLLSRRSRRGIPVTAEDLLRLIPYADSETREIAQVAA